MSVNKPERKGLVLPHWHRFRNLTWIVEIKFLLCLKKKNTPKVEYYYFLLGYFIHRNSIKLYIYIYILIYLLFLSFLLHWVFTAALGFLLVEVSWSYSFLWCVDFSLRWFLLWSTGSRAWAQ